MKQVIQYVLLICTITPIVSCTQSIKDWVVSGSSAPPVAPSPPPTVLPLVATWNFSDSSKYTFDSNFIAISGGKVSLKQVDRDHTGNDFNSGIHTRTFINQNDNISLQDSTYGEHSATWTPQYTALVGHWKFNESKANAAPGGVDLQDYSGNAYHLTETGSVIYGNTGKVGQSIELDGVNDYFSRNISGGPISLMNFDSDYSFSIWIRSEPLQSSTPNTENKPWRIDATTGYLFNLLFLNQTSPSYGKIRVWRWNGSSGKTLTSVSTLLDNQFHHIAVTRSGPTLKLFIDGILEDTQTEVATGNAFITSMNFGSSSAGVRFDGDIDEAALWNVGLSDAEVSTIYSRQATMFAEDRELNSSWAPFWTDVVGHWKMDGNWLDYSVNTNHGTENGDASFSSEAQVGTLSGVFDGDGDFIQIPHHSSIDFGLNDSFTIAAWLKTGVGSATGNSKLIYKRDGSSQWYTLHLQNQTTLAFESSGGASLSSGVNIVDNTWHHVITTVDRLNAQAHIYVDGILRNSGVFISDVSNTSDLFFSVGNNLESFNGSLDELTIWKKALKARDVSLIYNFQKQKYSGYYKSPIIDMGSEASWESIVPKTPLPFGKKVTSNGFTESSNDYSSLTADLSVGLLGLWHLDEASYNGTANEVLDSSGNLAHGTLDFGSTQSEIGISKKSINFIDGSLYNINVSNNLPNMTDELSLSFWLKSSASDQSYPILFHRRLGLNGWLVQKLDTGLKRVYIRIDTSGGSNQTTGMTTSEVIDGDWHHLVFTINTGAVRVYVDGQLEADSSYLLGGGFSGSPSLYIGNGPNVLTSNLDEVALWSRELTLTEVVELYRRTANRVKYQVKSCVDASCFCQSFNTSPNGIASDCDGDGLQNDVDPVDSFRSQWVGRDGPTGSSFSELQNCLTIDSITTGKCTGTVNSVSPLFSFANYPSLAQASNNRYFQYRVLMESEKNMACTGAHCLPELTAIKIGPPDGFFGGSPTITSKTAVTYTQLESIEFSDSNCNASYQLSPNGTTYWYWNGSNWTTASGENVMESASGLLSNSNIASFTAQAGSGQLHWRAFLTSDTSQACELTQVQLSYLK